VDGPQQLIAKQHLARGEALANWVPAMSVVGAASALFHSGYGGLWCLAIIAVQCGVQPFLSKACIPPQTPTSSLVLAGELVKILGCLPMLCHEGSGRHALGSWTLRSSLVAAGIPSVTYLVQNYCVQIAYQSLDGVVFNVLNQSKALFTALFAFLIVGRQQSRMQCAALVLVTLGGVLVSVSSRGAAGNAGEQRGRSTIGVACALLAAALSGLGSGITEWALRRGRRNPFLLSTELAILGCILILASLLLGLTADSEVWRREGLFARWRLLTMVPVLTQSLGGILVGVITKVAGGVQKVLATICGLILSCVLQQVLYGGLPQPSVCVSVPLVAVGIYLHASYPPKIAGSARPD